MTRNVAAVAMTVTFGVIPGCGGSAPTTYDADAVRSCLSENRLSVLDDLNKYAPTSRNFKVVLGDTSVYLSFATTEEVAKRVEATIAAVAGRVTEPSDVRVARERNLVYYSDAAGFDDVTGEIETCLR